MHPLRIAIPIYENVDLIDVTVPYDALSRIPQFWRERDLELDLVAETLDPVCTGQTLLLTPTKTFADFKGVKLDVLLVPGATDTSPATKCDAFMKFIAEHADSQLVASVCTGALILAAAKLLDGYRATTHWLALGDLKATDAVRVVNEFPRWVHDRDRLTGGGISSSLDATIYLISRITSEETAKCVQLLLQYNPHPPFATGDPSVADTDTYLRVAYNK